MSRLYRKWFLHRQVSCQKSGGLRIGVAEQCPGINLLLSARPDPIRPRRPPYMPSKTQCAWFVTYPRADQPRH
jgi:hypothetical protein